MKISRLYYFSFFGIVIGLEPAIFYVPFDFVFRMDFDHLSLGHVIALFFLPIIALYNLITAMYLMFKTDSDSYMVLIFFALFFVQTLLTLNEFGAFS